MSEIIFVFLLFFEESAIIHAPSETAVEAAIINLVSWLRLFIEMIGAGVIAVGIILAVIKFARAVISSESVTFTQVRLHLARYLALALEFQLGADILSTAIAPSWDQIGKLGAIAVIRTFLNYFLSLEMQREEKLSEQENKSRSNDGKTP